MKKKKFIVTHARARAPIIVKGDTLEEALASEGLDPNIWKEAAQDHKMSEPKNGDNQGDAGEENN